MQIDSSNISKPIQMTPGLSAQKTEPDQTPITKAINSKQAEQQSDSTSLVDTLA